ncbi:MAG: hypothetical protein ACT4P8_17540 [Betaproteobacteria bacterium]
MRRYTRNQHRFFDQLVVFFSAIAGLGPTLLLHSQKQSKPYVDEDRIAIRGVPTVSNLVFRYAPLALIETLLRNKWPNEVIIEEAQMEPMAPELFSMTGLKGIIASGINFAFLHYMESVRSLIKTKYTSDTSKWPETINFARVVRNTTAHGGRISIENANAKPVSWRSLTYSYADNGKAVLFVDLTAVELIILMEEVDALI